MGINLPGKGGMNKNPYVIVVIEHFNLFTSFFRSNSPICRRYVYTGIQLSQPDGLAAAQIKKHDLKTRSKTMKFNIKTLLFTISLLFGAASAQAACTGCTPIGPLDPDLDDPFATYSAVVSYITWHTNAQGRRYHQVNYLTLTGSTMAYCQQQLSAATNSPGVSVVQFCQKD